MKESLTSPLKHVGYLQSKTCCPNGCPKLDANDAIPAIVRSTYNVRLLRAPSSPIAFDEADESRVTECLSNTNAMHQCYQRLAGMLMLIGVDTAFAASTSFELVQDVVGARSYEELDKIGLKWHGEFLGRGFYGPIDQLMMGRNQWLANLIAPHLLPGTAIDHDSGDSYVARLIQSKRPDVRIQTQDAFDFRAEVRELPMTLYDYSTKVLPYDNSVQFDNAILATVLHHCDEPEKMFDEVIKFLRKGGRLFLFENVFAQGDGNERDVNVFFDWFFNKIFHRCGLPLPFSHFCRSQWREFLTHKGFRITHADENLGRWPSIPLEHVLYVATKE